MITQFKIEFLLPPTGCRKVVKKMPDNVYMYIYKEFYQDHTYINILIQKYNLTSLTFSCSLYVLPVASSFDSNLFNMRILFRFRNETERP